MSDNQSARWGASWRSRGTSEPLHVGWLRGSISWASPLSACVARHHNRWPGSSIFFFSFYKAGTVYCHLPLHPLPLAAQMAGCSLVRFLWCMLWWRISSSERANFFWQLDQRQVKGFSPDEEGTDKGKNRRNVCFRVNSPLGNASLRFRRIRIKTLRRMER